MGLANDAKSWGDLEDLAPEVDETPIADVPPTGEPVEETSEEETPAE